MLRCLLWSGGAQAAVSGNVVSTLRALGGALVASLLAATFFGSDA